MSPNQNNKLKEIRKPAFNIGDTVVLERRWFLWFRDFVLCEIVAGRWVFEEYELDFHEKIRPQWRYTLKIGNQFKRFCMWEYELLKANSNCYV